MSRRDSSIDAADPVGSGSAGSGSAGSGSVGSGSVGSGSGNSDSPVEIGQVIAGKYRIERQIGRGGMGVVMAAVHLQLERTVAIKVVRRDLLEDERSLDRLLAEARAAAKVRSEHVARVLDVGTLDGGSPFIVMEYLDGEDLADVIDRVGAFPVERAVGFVLQACEALAEVHVADMVHRDLKPGNLFIARLPDGSPTMKIVDFGISKYVGGPIGQRGATTSPQVLGSPFYMAPEQMRAEAVDARSDIWALGAILFEMLTGETPFSGETLPEVYAAVLSETPPALEALRADVPPGLDDVVQRCLAKDPTQRFCDVAELAEALLPFSDEPTPEVVDRVTRILTNPDLQADRRSLAPVSVAGAPFAGAAPGAGMTSRSGTPSDGVRRAVDDRSAGAAAADAGPSLSETGPRSGVDAFGTAPRRPLSSPSAGSRSALAASGSGPPVGSSASGDALPELGAKPLSGRSARGAWVAVAVAAATLGAAAWLVVGAGDADVTEVRVEALAPPPGPEPGSVEPVPSRSSSPPAAPAEHSGSEPTSHPESFARRPSPASTSSAAEPTISVERFRQAVRAERREERVRRARRQSTARAAPRRLEPRPRPEATPAAEEAEPVAAPPAPAPVPSTDPWDPSSFGARR